MITSNYSEITLIDFCPLHTFYWFSLFCRADITNIAIFCTHLKICFPYLQIVLPKDFFFWQIYLLPFLQTFISNFFANISVQDFCMQIFLSKIFLANICHLKIGFPSSSLNQRIRLGRSLKIKDWIMKKDHKGIWNNTLRKLKIY